jgi:hypothetical protein
MFIPLLLCMHQLLVKFRVHSMIQYTETDVVGNQNSVIGPPHM